MAAPERTSQLPVRAYALNACNGPSHRGSILRYSLGEYPSWSRCCLQAAGQPIRPATTTTHKSQEWLQPIRHTWQNETLVLGDYQRCSKAGDWKAHHTWVELGYPKLQTLRLRATDRFYRQCPRLEQRDDGIGFAGPD
jgi:hypothetical protein